MSLHAYRPDYCDLLWPLSALSGRALSSRSGPDAVARSATRLGLVLVVWLRPDLVPRCTVPFRPLSGMLSYWLSHSTASRLGMATASSPGSLVGSPLLPRRYPLLSAPVICFAPCFCWHVGQRYLFWSRTAVRQAVARPHH